MMEITEREVKAFLETDDGEKLANSIADKRVAEGIATYAANHPVTESPDVQELLSERDAEIDRLKVENALIEKCHEKHIDIAMLRELGVTFADVSEIDSKLESLADRLSTLTTANVNARLVNESFKPGGSSVPPDAIRARDLSQHRANFLESIGALDDLS